MKREDILKIADRYGLLRLGTMEDGTMQEDILGFAEAIAEAEREECAKVCDRIEADVSRQGFACECADAIRARGKE